MSEVIKHCGVISSTGSRVFVFWRQLEDEPDNCLFVYRDSLPDVYSSAVLGLVMGEGQNSTDLYEVANARGILQGRNMLNVLHNIGALKKCKTSEIMMHVGGSQQIRLDQLNEAINQHRGTQSKIVNTVDKDSPFEAFDEKKSSNLSFSSSIVSQLVEQAIAHHNKFVELKQRAIALDPKAQDSMPTQDVVTKIIEVPVQPETSDNVFVIPEGISMSKAVELLKEHMRSKQ